MKDSQEEIVASSTFLLFCRGSGPCKLHRQGERTPTGLLHKLWPHLKVRPEHEKWDADDKSTQVADQLDTKLVSILLAECVEEVTSQKVEHHTATFKN